MRRTHLLAASAGLFSLVGIAALPDSDDGPGRLPMVADRTTQKACSECHMAYPPQVLPPESWHAILSNLRNHFGTDAHFDPATTAAIEAYLVSHAAPMRGISPTDPPLKIVDMPWFVARHSGVMRGHATAGMKYEPMADCYACHNGMGGGGGDD